VILQGSEVSLQERFRVFGKKKKKKKKKESIRDDELE
jgi:hypothetical protein